MATIPNASVRTFPPIACVAPTAKGSRKVAVKGPEATLPESNAMAVNNGETKKVNSKAMAYPGKTIYQIEIPVTTRSIESPTDIATPMDKLRPNTFPEICPSVISSTCCFSTLTAGSAATMKKPSSIPSGIRVHW